MRCSPLLRGLARAGIFALLIALPSAARAVPFELRFEGSITLMDAATVGTLLPGVSLGDSITVVVTLDSDAPDADPVPNRGFYSANGPPYGASIQLGDTLLTSSEIFVRITNDFPIPVFQQDLFSISGVLDVPVDATIDTFQVSLTTSLTGDPLSDDSLPTGPGSFSGSPNFSFNYFLQEDTVLSLPLSILTGPVTLVPEPSSLALALFGCGAGAASSRRWRRRQSLRTQVSLLGAAARREHSAHGLARDAAAQGFVEG